MAEQAYAYVTLIPVAKGFQKAIAQELGGAANNVGKSAGTSVGNFFKSGFNAAISGLFAVTATAAATAMAAAGFTITKGFSRLSGIEEAQAKLRGLGHDAESVALIMDNALGAVRGTAFGMADAATISASAVAAGVKPGEELASYLKTVADTAYIAGAGLNEVGYILNKATTAGKAHNDVLQMLSERGIPIYQMLADQAGVTAGAIFDMASDGEISSGMLIKALDTNLSGAALKSGDTVKGAFENTLAAISRVGANFLGPVFPMFKDFFLGIIDLLGPVEQKAKEWGQTFADQLQPIRRIFGLFRSGAIDSGDAMSMLIENLMEKFNELRVKLVTAIMKAIPGMIDGAFQFFTAMVTGLVNALPGIVDALLRVISALIDMLVKNIPMFLDAAFELFMAVVDGLSLIIPELITALTDLLPVILDKLVSFLPDILTAAIDLFLVLVDAILEATPDIINALLDLIPKLVEALVGAIPQILDGVGQLLGAMATFIIENGPEIIGNALKAVWESLVAVFGGNVDVSVNGASSSTYTTGPSMSSPVGNYTAGSYGSGGSFTYNAAPNQSLDSARDLNDAMRKARLLNW